MVPTNKMNLPFEEIVCNTVDFCYYLYYGIYPEFTIEKKSDILKPDKILEFILSNKNKFSILNRRFTYGKSDVFGLGLITKTSILEKGEERILFIVNESSSIKNKILILFSQYYEDDFRVQIAGKADQEEEMKKILLDLFDNKFKREKHQEIGLITNNNGYIELRKCELKPLKVDIELNYGKNFVEVHKTINKKINSKNGGLYIFRGAAGSGKSSYIRYLTQLCDKTFAYVPVQMIDALLSPNFTSFLLENKNIVLVIEDAEKAVVSREQNSGNESIVSAILNLSDGILSSLLNTSIIITFNTNSDNIDKALTRKGRLLFDYEFGSLTLEDSQKLIDKLKKNHTATQPMTLSDIYNLEDKDFSKKEDKKIIGFSQ